MGLAALRMGTWLTCVVLAAACSARTATPQQEFTERLEEYLETRAAAVRQTGGTLTPGSTGEELTAQSDRLAQTIQALRVGLGRNVLVPRATAAQIRADLAARLGLPDGDDLRAVIREVQPSGFMPAVNTRYPESVPRSTVPAGLLDVLPRLPIELEYRFVGRDLLMLDRNTSVILDIISDALPVP